MKDYENFSKEYGVTNRSILLDALYCDVTEQIPQDVMHVILDGSLSRTLYFVIHYFLDNNIFTLEGLNAFILDFNYGYSEMKDKPVDQFGWSRQRFEKSWSNNILKIWLFSRVFAFFGQQHAHHLPKVWRTLLAVLAKRSLSIYLVTLKGS